jgi:purine-binding chemotaxis protein CheW
VTAFAPAGLRVDALRTEFDSVFALPPRAALDEWTELLAIAVGDDPYALRLSELAGLYADKPVTPLPGAPADVRGLAGFRGAVVVVYDVAALLGAPRAAACRWLVAAAANPAVALAFARFEGHMRARPEQIAVADDTGPGAPWNEVLHADQAVRPIVSVPALLELIERPTRPSRQGSER